MQNKDLNYHLSKNLKNLERQRMRNRKFNTSNYSVRSLNISKYTTVKKKNDNLLHKRQNRNMNRIHTNNTYSTLGFRQESDLIKSQAFDQVDLENYRVPFQK